VDSAEAVSATRLLIALAILAVAAVLDIRTRKVGNSSWILMAVFGLVLLPVQLAVDNAPWEYLLVVVPILAILADVYFEGAPESLAEKYGPVLKYAIAVISVIIIGYLWGSHPYFQHLLAVPVMMLAVVALYMFDLIRGGADAKAFISLSVLFPFYPVVGGLPIVAGSTELSTVVFPFAFTVLVNAAIIVAVIVPLAFLVRNAVAGDLRFPNALFGRRIGVDLIDGNRFWLMERIEHGKHVYYSRPRRNEDLGKELDLLKSAGVNRVWVTPKIPFMVPILASLVASAIVGNFLSLLFPL